MALTPAVVLVIAVVLGAACLLWGRLLRQPLPLLCGLGMIATACVALERLRPALALLAVLAWLLLAVGAVLARPRRQRRHGGEEDPDRTAPTRG